MRTSCASKTGAPQITGVLAGREVMAGGEWAARMIQRVSAVEGTGFAATRSNKPVTPEAWAARVSHPPAS